MRCSSRWTKIGAVLALTISTILANHLEHDTSIGDVTDICAPLIEAQTIHTSLLPSPNAHLIDKLGSLASSPRGWGEGLGWSHDGPLATTFRLIPRVLKSLSPTSLINTIVPAKRSRKGSIKISRARRDKIERMLGLITLAESQGCVEAASFIGKIRMFPPKGVKQDLTAAFDAYTRVLETTSDPEAQFFIGFFHATGLGGIIKDQGKATLYYTFAALQGYRPAEMAMGYRHWAGIGVKEDCLQALDWYEAAARKGYNDYLDGPPGGRTFPFTPTRLSDRDGGIYGPHASWASTGINSLRAASRSFSAASKGESVLELLEFYQYHSDRDSYDHTVRLGRLFYLGSIYPLLGGVSHGAEGVGEIPRDYRKAKEYFTRVARQYWLTDYDADGKVTPKRRLSKEQDAALAAPAMVAAAFLGRMALRGEGSKPDYKRARLWYERAAELGDREAHNGLGIIHRDGLLTPVNIPLAYKYFTAAAGSESADAQVNLAKIHLDRGETSMAQQYLQAAIGHGSPYEAFHLLARIHAQAAREGTRPGICGVSVAWYKLSAEKGNWGDDFVGEADRAWLRGEEEKAMLGWWVAAEMGYEAGQNNVAYAIEKGIGERVQWVKSGGLELWIRSAAQDNVDAMVKVGDYFYYESGFPEELRYARAANYYQTAADTQMSAMAYWNLGWMYETGKGVPRDWLSAKRFYDLSMDTTEEAYFPACLSLLGLYFRSWWVEIRSRGEIPRLALFDDEPEEAYSRWEQIKGLFGSVKWEGEAVEEGQGQGQGEILDGEDDYYDYSGAGAWRDDRVLEDGEDFVESLMILGLMGMVVGLIWVRNRWFGNAQRVEGEVEPREAPAGWEPPLQ